MDNYYVGLMSGTSLDAIDAVLIRIDDHDSLEVVSLLNTQFPDHIPAQLRNLISGGTESLHALCSLDSELGEIYANVTLDLLSKSACKAHDIRAIGCHGQTIRHQPDCRHPYSLQIGNPSVIAEKTGITTVADFRARDIAAGGQGAPLVPIGDELLFANYDFCLNLGGFSNISYKSEGNRIAYDSSPVNIILNYLMNFLGKEFDRNRETGKQGKLHTDLFDQLNQIRPIY